MTDERLGEVKLATHGRLFDTRVDDVEARLDASWYRGDSANYHPEASNLRDERAVWRHVLDGWLPTTPHIDRSTKITAFGSCFAIHVSRWLSERNYAVLTSSESSEEPNAYVVKFGAGMVNTFVIRDQFEWALENAPLGDQPWYGNRTVAYDLNEDVRQATRSLFLRSDLFILTLGLSEVWYDADTGRVFWKGVPQRLFDPRRHRFRVSSVNENVANLRAIHALIRKYRPEARLLLTVSPVPLAATFRDVSCISANSVSKAVLRAAVDEFLREAGDDPLVHYWPSYEIVTTLFSNQWTEELRHPRNEVLDYTMTVFETAWCRDSVPRMTLAEAWIKARSACRSLPEGTPVAIETGDIHGLSTLVERLVSMGRSDDVRLLLRRCAEVEATIPHAGKWLEETRRRFPEWAALPGG